MPTALQNCLQLLIRLIRFYRGGILNYSSSSLAERGIENTTEKWPKNSKKYNYAFFMKTHWKEYRKLEML